MRVYRYGIVHRGPLPDEAQQQLFLANRLWNECVEIHRRHDGERRTLMDSASAEVARLVADREAINTEIERHLADLRRARQRERGNVSSVALRKILSDLKERRTSVSARLKEARAEARESIRDELSAAKSTELAEIKAARQKYAAAGLYWATSNAILRGFDVAVQREAKDRAPGEAARLLAEGRKPSQPQFRRYDGCGTWDVQIVVPEGSASLLWRDVVAGEDKRLAVSLGSGGVEEVVAKNGRTIQRKVMPQVRMQIRGTRGKGPDGQWTNHEPAWLAMPVVVHREPAPDDRVVAAQIVRERIGGKYRHNLCVTVDDPVPEPRSGPAVAVDIGWRRTEEGRLRVAYWVGEDGNEGEVLLPQWTPGAPHQHLRGVEPTMLYADELEGKRDVLLNTLQAGLAAWWVGRELPDWLREVRDGRPEIVTEDGRTFRATRPMREWRSQERVAEVFRRWRDARFDGDGEGFDRMAEWYNQDVGFRDKQVGLREAAANARDQATAQRTDAWRKVAYQLATRYALIGAEVMAIPRLTHKQATEEGPASEGTILRRAARMAAPGSLRLAIQQAAVRHGATYMAVDARKSTIIHYDCGLEVKADFAASIYVYCPHCDMWYDQDRNAARVLLDRMRASGPSGDTDPEGARGSTAPRARGRFQRAKQAKAEREAGGARAAGE